MSSSSDLAIKQDLAEPDPLRLAWLEFIKQTIREVIIHPELDALSSIQKAVLLSVPSSNRASVQALILEELRRLHEGVLARYGLRASDYTTWKAVQLGKNA
jgi:hypothetical protein